MTLSPSPTSFIPDTTRREALRKETSNVPIRTSLSQSMGEYISMTKTHPVNALYFDGKTISKSSTIISSSSIYHESKIQDSAKQHRAGVPDEIIAGSVAGGLTVLILIGILLLAVILKRRKKCGSIVAQSNTEASFDNLGFNSGRKISEYMDLSELELVRVKVTNTVKRKMSAFTKENQKTNRVSCGRLDLVEVPVNSHIDDDILLTAWV